MNIMALLPAFLVLMGIGWAVWLIFKRDLLSQNIVKLLTYFLGVVITFIVIGWLIDTFLPQWTLQRLITARNSPEVATIETIGREMWQEAIGRPGAPQPIAPAPTLSPAPTPVAGEQAPVTSQGAGLRTGERSHAVVKGDNLYRLSIRFGVSVAAIQQRNGLGTSTNIKVGQVLIIPAP